MVSVSVIIPCYNQGRYLPEALDSMLAQTYSEWEAIVVDDGSTDETGAVGQRYSIKDARIRYMYQENGGESSARNSGLDLAQGEYIGFLDADDLYLPNALADHVAFLRTNTRYSVSYADGFFCTEDGRKLYRLSETRERPYEGKVLEHLVVSPNNLITNCTMTRASAIRDGNVRFDLNLTIGPDWDFWIRLSERVEFGYLDADTCLYRVHATNITRTSGRRRRQMDLLAGRRKVMEAPWFEELPTATRRAFFANLLNGVAMGLPEHQEAIIRSLSFGALASSDRAVLLRQLATRCILDRQDSSLAEKYLGYALRESPADRSARILSGVLSVSPPLALAAVWGWHQMNAAVGAITGIGKRRPRASPRELRPVGD